jgi:hypothetical protein
LIDLRYVIPPYNAWTHAVRQMQSIDNRKAPRSLMLPHARVEPLHSANNVIKMIKVRTDGKSALIFRSRKGPIGVRLGEMNQCSDFFAPGRIDVAANQSVDQPRFTYARRSFYE